MGSIDTQNENNLVEPEALDLQFSNSSFSEGFFLAHFLVHLVLSFLFFFFVFAAITVLEKAKRCNVYARPSRISSSLVGEHPP